MTLILKESCKDSIAKLSESIKLSRYASNAAAYPQAHSPKSCNTLTPVTGVLHLLSPHEAALSDSQDAQQFNKQHTASAKQVQQIGSTGHSPRVVPPKQPLNELLAQYHEIWSSMDQQEAKQQTQNDLSDDELPMPIESSSLTVSLSEMFTPFNISKCIEKVSLQIVQGQSLEETETSETPKVERIAQRITESFNANQAPQRQLCHIRAHLREQDEDIFQNLRGADDTSFVRPHAQSMTQATSSPQWKPLQTRESSEDVRSLLYSSSDSDEIESLVFNQAEHHCLLEECNEECESLFKQENCSDQTRDEDSWSTSYSQNLASAFECDIQLLQLDIVESKYKGLRVFTNE